METLKQKWYQGKMPGHIHAELKRAVALDGLTIEQYINLAVKEKLIRDGHFVEKTPALAMSN